MFDGGGLAACRGHAARRGEKNEGDEGEAGNCSDSFHIRYLLLGDAKGWVVQAPLGSYRFPMTASVRDAAGLDPAAGSDSAPETPLCARTNLSTAIQ